MSFFQEETDDSNLQYDNAAFLYFIGSALIVSAGTTLAFIVKDLLSLSIPDKSAILATGYLTRQVQNLAEQKRRRVFNKWFFIKVILLLILIALTVNVYNQSRRAENKMKGFDPFEILGLSPRASMRDVKKAYRKLALEYHPDRNQGNSQAQAKFILISKSYQCFADETKTANCFKYGNPDGTDSFRVGIGLPKFFIQAEYKWFVLPIVLSIFLIVVPCLILNWSNRTRYIDPNGVSIKSYKTLFDSVEKPFNKYSVLIHLSSYVELYQHPCNPPISEANRQALNAELDRNPQARRQALSRFTDRQLNAYWEIFKYCSGKSEFSDPAFRQILESLLEKACYTVKSNAIKANDGFQVMNNPQWTIHFIGVSVIEYIVHFGRDYYNRSFLQPQKYLWLNHLSLTRQEHRQAIEFPMEGNLYLLLKSPQKVNQFVNQFSQNRREAIRRQLSELPIYDCRAKVEVDGKQVQEITSNDYADVKFEVSRQPGHKYCVLKNYPFPKEEQLVLIAVSGGSLVHFQKIKFRKGQNRFIGNFPLRVGVLGTIEIQLFFLSTTYYELDYCTRLNIKVVELTAEQLNKKIEFHPEDLNIEKTHKSFFEELMDMQLDAEENELSDSEEEEDEQEEEGEEGEGLLEQEEQQGQ